MMLGSACSGKCCLCACGSGCIAGHGDDYFSPASKEQIINRLEKGEYPDYTDIMKKYLKEGFGYNYGNNEREDKNMNKNFTKADLKAGYVVKYRSGELRMVLPYRRGLVITDIDGQWLNLVTELNDDLTAGATTNNLDVMEVYGLSAFGSTACRISTFGRELLWKREEEKPAKKMTVSEIEKALGYKVEVVADEK